MMDFEKKYKSEINKQSVLPTDIWDSIAEQLDLNDIWNSIDDELTKKRKLALLWKDISRFAAVFLITLIPLALKDTFVEFGKSTSTSVGQNTIGNTEISANNITHAKPKESNSYESDYSAKSILTTNKADFFYAEPKGLDLRNLSLTKSIGFLPLEEEILKPKPKETLKIITFGINQTFRNTWLLSNKTLNAFSAQEISSNQLTFGKAFGGEVGMEYKNTQAILQLFLNSDGGQDYQDYRKGKLIEQQYNLSYVQSNMFLKTKRGIVAGGYGSTLKSGTKTEKGTEYNLAKTYSKTDFGLILGKEFDLAISKHLVFVYGAKANLGLKNIYKGQSEVDSKFHRTRNSSFDVGASVRYRF